MESTSSEKSYTTTPLKSLKTGGSSFVARHHLYNKSPNPYKTPVRHKVNSTEINISATNSFKSVIIDRMPIYSPPPKTSSFVKNPFEHARLLKERLSQPVCSPSLFKAMSSPAQSNDFTWSIEDISVLHPADIDENPSQDFNAWFSPVTENEAQEAINRFFSSQLAGLESPALTESKKKNCKCAGKSSFSLDTWTQTDLTFPPNLPPEVEAILVKYCNFNNGQQDQDHTSSPNSSNSSRKNLLLRTFESPDPKNQTMASASTPITSRLSSPELSPVNECSMMDISMRNKSVSKLNLTNDVEMIEKENLMPKEWEFQGYSTPRAMKQFTDSAFSSM